MAPIKVHFVISQLSEGEVEALKDSRSIITKMILFPDDYKLFNYKKGDAIEVETQIGNRLWCTIQDIEVVENEERIILIFTLMKADSTGQQATA